MGKKFHWENLSDEELLNVRICDLGVSLEDGPDFFFACVRSVEQELEAKGIKFRPYYWLSNEWFTPDEVPGIAVPFFLFHPRLVELEKSQMLELEGGTRETCLKILRHETGHAIENAYELRRKRIVHKVFGRSSSPYPETYAPRPYSKKFVLHLDSWYAQSHPDEDFAETFAVWLTPDMDWKKKYEGWPALKKLELMDSLMNEIVGVSPPNKTKRKVDPASKMKTTLGEFYEERIDHYGLNYPDFYDRDLGRLFGTKEEFPDGMPASRFIQAHRKDIRRHVALWTETYRYLIDSTVRDMIKRCKELDLRLKNSEEEALVDFKLLIAIQTMNFLHSGEHRVAL